MEKYGVHGKALKQRRNLVKSATKYICKVCESYETETYNCITSHVCRCKAKKGQDDTSQGFLKIFQKSIVIEN